jgi:hypothetical protein
MTESENIPFAPEDLQLLQDVYEEVCGIRNIEKADAGAVASELVQLYQLGVRDEEQLKAFIS